MECCSIDSQLIIKNSIDIIQIALNGSDELVKKIIESNTTTKKNSINRQNGGNTHVKHSINRQNGGDCTSLRRRLVAAGFLSLILAGTTCNSISTINQKFGLDIGITNIHLYLKEAYDWAWNTKIGKAYNNSAKFSDPVGYYKSYITTPIHYIKQIKPTYTDFIKPNFLLLTNKICDLISSSEYHAGRLTEILREVLEHISG